MNEELQSTNEELQTLNDELRDRTLEVDRVNGFLQSILAGLELAVVVVDTGFRVQLWNGGAERLTGPAGVRGRGAPAARAGALPALRPGADGAALRGRRGRGARAARRRDDRPLRASAATPADRDTAAAGKGEVHGAVLTLADTPAVVERVDARD
jgi:two-component system CheB/CheR fusion protein